MRKVFGFSQLEMIPTFILPSINLRDRLPSHVTKLEIYPEARKNRWKYDGLKFNKNGIEYGYMTINL